MIVENLPLPAHRREWQECLALRDAGYEVSVICPRGHGYTRSHEVLHGVHIYRHGLPFEARGIAGFILEYSVALLCEVWLAWRVFFTRGFDIIQACNPPDMIWLVAAPFKLFGRKFVFDHCDPFPELVAVKFPHREVIGRLAFLAERLSIRTADLVITTSEALRSIAIERGGTAPEKVHLVRSSPDLTKMRRVARDSDLRGAEGKVVVYMGVMGSQDGVDVLLRAARAILHTHGRADIRHVLVGDGPELERLRQMARELNILQNVTFTGFLRGEKLLAALSSADLGACPDPRNPFNDKLSMCKVLEYMAMELPTVMFDLAEGRRIAGDAAVYVQGDEPEALAQGILDLIDDADRCRRMGAYARARVERLFDWADQQRVYLNAYAGL